MLYIPSSIRECSKCFQWLSLSSFRSDKGYADGYTRRCKRCCSVAVMESHKKNPDVTKRAMKKYRATPKARENDKRFYYRHKDKARAKRIKFFSDNPTYGKDYYHRNKAKITAKFHRRAARKRSLPETLTTQDWERAIDYFGNCCAVCGRPRGLWHTLAMDHWIPLANPLCPGTIPTNIIPLCHGQDGCNQSKSSHNPTAWLVERFGKRKAKQIEQRITDYFDWIAKHR